MGLSLFLIATKIGQFRSRGHSGVKVWVAIHKHCIVIWLLALPEARDIPDESAAYKTSLDNVCKRRRLSLQGPGRSAGSTEWELDSAAIPNKSAWCGVNKFQF